MKKFIAVLLTASALSTGAIAETPNLNDVKKESAWAGPNLSRTPTVEVKKALGFIPYGSKTDQKDVLLPKAPDGSLFGQITGDQNRVEVNQAKGGGHHAVVNIGGKAQAVLTAHNDPGVYSTDKSVDIFSAAKNALTWGQQLNDKMNGAQNKGVGNHYGKEKANNNVVKIDQVNSHGQHLAFVNLVGDDNKLNIKQDGTFQTAFVQLGDSGSDLTIDQKGSNNTASVQMMQGALIESQILQENSKNQAHVIGAENTGTFSKLYIDQTKATDSVAMVSFGNLNGANGGNNSVSIHQQGTAFANVGTNGFSNTVIVNQGK